MLVPDFAVERRWWWVLFRFHSNLYATQQS